MTDEDLTAFIRHWADHNHRITTGSAAYFHGRNAWFAALTHRDKQVAELVRVVERIYKRHLVPLANQEGQSTLRMDLNALDDAIEQLKDDSGE